MFVFIKFHCINKCISNLWTKWKRTLPYRQHVAPITAGMWGAKPLLDMDFSHFFISKIFEASLNPDILRNEKYTDQTILARYLYPYLNGN